jgi:hypothetical protein
MSSVSRYHLVFVLCCSLLLATSILVFDRWPDIGHPKKRNVAFALETLAESDAQGTPPRIEREFKIGLLRPDDLGFNTPNEELKIFQSRVYSALKTSLEDDAQNALWIAPKLFGEEYFVDRDPMVFVSRDFYMDTADDLLWQRVVLLSIP